jgi:hypothetical protein
MTLAISAAMPRNRCAPRFVTVVETPVFARRADELLTARERDELVAFLAANPTAGDLVEGTGGTRKVRFAGQGRGRSGGVRVVHYFAPQDGPPYALLICGKGEQADTSPEGSFAVGGEILR